MTAIRYTKLCRFFLALIAAWCGPACGNGQGPDIAKTTSPCLSCGGSSGETVLAGTGEQPSASGGGAGAQGGATGPITNGASASGGLRDAGGRMNSDGGMSGNIGAAGRAGAGGLGTGGGAGSRAGKGGAGSGGTSGNAEPCDSGTVSGTRARELVAQGALLLDVRTASEFARGNLAGAINIPLDELPDRLGELPKDKTIVTYCSSGSRASQAADLLRRQGFTVCNLGPMSAW